MENENRIIIKCDKCNKEYSINNYIFYFRSNNNYNICTICNPIGSNYNKSHMESQLQDFIQENYNGEVIFNTRDLITPHEIDIYIPELNLAFEFNGLYWHSEIKKEKSYHYDKFKKCDELGIQLIQIWEDSWVIDNDITLNQ